MKSLAKLCLLVPIFVCLLTSQAMAKAVGSITYVEPLADVLHSGEVSFTPVSKGDSVFEKDVARTKRNGKARIELTNGTILSLAPFTRVDMEEYLREVKRTGVIKLSRGKVRVVTPHRRRIIPISFKKEPAFEVHTHTAVIGIRGSDGIVWETGYYTTAVCISGRIEVRTTARPEVVRIVGPSEMVVMPRGLLLEAPPPTPVSESRIRMLAEDTAPIYAEEPEEVAEAPEEVEAEVAEVEAEEVAEAPPAGPEMDPGETATVEAPAAAAEVPPAVGMVPDTSLLPVTEAVDTTPPMVTLTSTPPSVTNSTTADFDFTAHEPATFSYTLDGGSSTTATAPLTLTDLSEGTHTFEVTATDAAGNTSPATSYIWTTDYTAPVTSITASPPSVTNSTTADFDFTAHEPATFSYSLDSGLSSAATAPLSLTDLSESIHTLELEATDSAGNVSTASHEWLIGLRHYTLEGLVAGTGSTLTGSVSGDYCGISDENWGGWLSSLSGTYTGTPSPSWHMVAGGSGYDDSGILIAYWLETATGTGWSANTLSGNSSLTYLSYDRLGIGMGTVTGTYSGGNWQATDLGLGTCTETPLDFRGSLNSVYWASAQGEFVEDGLIAGLMGGITDLWSESPAVRLIGSYTNNMPLWAMDMTGTTDDEAFLGLLGFTSLRNDLTGNVLALYVKPGGSAGYLSSSATISGTLYPGIGMWEADGNVTAGPMGTTTVLTEDLSWANLTQSSFYGSITDDSFLTGGIVGQSYGIADQDWGIFRSMAGGYTLTEEGYWIAYGIGKYNDYIGNTYGHCLTETALRSFSGDISSSDTTTWAMSNVFTETPLTFVSEFSSVIRYGGVYQYAVEDEYGRNYVYEYVYGYLDDNGLGWMKHEQADGSWTYRGYYLNGTWLQESYSASTGLTKETPGTWNPEILDLAALANPPESDYLSYETYQWPQPDYRCDLNGLMGGTQSLWDGSSDVTIIGSYYSETPDHPHVWYSPHIFSTGTTYDGGTYYGFTGGIELNNTLEGRFVALYIDPYGYAGYLSGDLSGYTHPDIDIFEAYGTLGTEPITEIGIAPSDLYDNLDWILLGDGMFLLDIQGEPWGIYMFDIGGSDTFPEGAWEEAIGQPGLDFYRLATVSYTASDGRLAGSLETAGISYFDLVEMSGNLLGTYDESTWQGVSLGTWKYTPLAWSADIVAAYHYYDCYYWDALDWWDYQLGIMGTTASPFASPGSPVDITLVGEAYPEGYISWWGYVEGSYADGSVLPVDLGGWPTGFIGGRTDLWGSMEGMLVSLYIDSAGNAGYLKGDFIGNYYDDINMFEATGTVTATQKAIGYDPANYICDYNFIDGYLYGSFSGGGAIESGDSIYNIGYGYLCSYTAWLEDSSYNPEPWGIFNIELGGYYDTPSDNWVLNLGGDCWRSLEPEEYWLATVTGSHWSDQRIAGTLSARYLTYTALGTIEGKVLGSSNTEALGTWEAIALGTFEETPLTFVSEFYSGLFYYDGTSRFLPDGWLYGLMGGTQSLWDGIDVPVTMIGEYYPESSQPHIWYSDDLYGYDYKNDTYTTYDAGAYYGFTGGIELNNSLEGSLVGLYVNPVDEYGVSKAGYLKGNFGGTAYREIEMFEMVGTINKTQVVDDIGIAPEALYDNLDWGFLEGCLAGSFDGEGMLCGETDYGHTLSIAGQPWGMYGLTIAGNNFENPYDSTIWEAAIGDYHYPEYSPGLPPPPLPPEALPSSYWLANMTGKCSDSKLEGTLVGKAITEYNLYEISGNILGTYDINTTWQAVSLGTYTSEPLAFVSDLYSDLVYYDGTSGYLVDDGQLYGLMGGTQSLWVATQESAAPVVVMGGYYPGWVDCTWRTVVYTYTYDDGAYFGGLGGIHLDDTLEGRFGALYIAPDSEGDDTYPAGYLVGSLWGTTYPDIEMFEAEGEIYHIQMTENCNTTPLELQTDFEASPLEYQYLTLNSWFVYPLMDYDGFTDLSIPYIESGGSVFIKSEPEWGNWFLEFGGTCTYTEPLESWTMGFSSIPADGDWSLLTGTRWYNELQIEGTQWSDNKIAGNAQGYFVDLDQAMTGIMVGETFGTFNPNDITTFEALAAGTCMETNTFLAMLGTEEGKAKLEALNIPVTEVYSSTLNNVIEFGGFDSIGCEMNLRLFGADFDSASGLLAAILKNGTYTGGPTDNSWSLKLGTGTDTATITGNLWSGGNWAGTMSGSTTLNQPGATGIANFNGAVAGTIDGPSSWSGTGAGIWNTLD